MQECAVLRLQVKVYIRRTGNAFMTYSRNTLQMVTGTQEPKLQCNISSLPKFVRQMSTQNSATAKDRDKSD